nr:immunoglobulin heavy chain junction region [Mus musculus]MBK4189739.1 immunoglobulin heavy chain junction region [Mus musculus]
CARNPIYYGNYLYAMDYW